MRGRFAFAIEVPAAGQGFGLVWVCLGYGINMVDVVRSLWCQFQLPLIIKIYV
jgi:hypothetical protein